MTQDGRFIDNTYYEQMLRRSGMIKKELECTKEDVKRIRKKELGKGVFNGSIENNQEGDGDIGTD